MNCRRVCVPGAFPVGLTAGSSNKLSPSPPTSTNSGHQVSSLGLPSTGASGLLQWPSPHTVHDILATSIAALPNPGTTGSASSSTSSSSLCPNLNNSHNHHQQNNNNNNCNNNNNNNNNDNENDNGRESGNTNNNDERYQSHGHNHHHPPHHSHHPHHPHHPHHHPQQYYASAALYHHHHNHPGASVTNGTGLIANTPTSLAFQPVMMQITGSPSQPGSPCN